MVLIDWVIVGIYLLAAAFLGVLFSKKASHSTADFFVAGRTLPWWLVGTSLVATTFSTDTPLFVAGLSRNEGIHGNWFWWSAAIGQTATIFFFAKYWRRTEAITELEFIAKRYDPSPQRSALRIFKVFFDGVFVNCMIMASVTLAATKVIQVVLGITPESVFSMDLWGDAVPEIVLGQLGQTVVLLVILAVVALGYSAASGLYGVAYTDLIQFGLAMLGTIWLAVVAFNSLEPGGLAANLEKTPGFHEQTIGMFPNMGAMDLLTFTLLIYVMVNWWASAPGSGYAVQRLLATKSERDSMLGFLWFAFCHYVIRPWPWIIVGLISMIYFPSLQGAEAERAFPLMIDKFLGPGVKGVMVAAMLAAYMSTIDTHLNWGASYLVNDLYQPFIKPNQPQKHYVRASRFAMVALMIVAVLVTTSLTGILAAYKFLGVIIGGTGSMLILRWYWWRVNAWAEITATATALVVGVSCEFLLANPVVLTAEQLLADPTAIAIQPTDWFGVRGMVAAWLPASGASTAPPDWFAVRLLVTTFATAFAWISVALITSRKPSPQTREFCKTVRVPGPGWKRVARDVGVNATHGEFGRSFMGWVAATSLIYSMLLGIGYALFEQWSAVGICAAIAVASAVVLARLLRSGALTGMEPAQKQPDPDATGA